MLNLLIICAIFFLIFSIIGVSLFSGLFYKCVSTTTGISLGTAVNSKTECLATPNAQWFNSKINFDNVGAGFLALFQVATFNGWLEIISDSVDITSQNKQPITRNTEYVYVYYVAFIMVGGIYVFKLITAVIIDNFNRLKKQVSWIYQIFMIGHFIFAFLILNLFSFKLGL